VRDDELLRELARVLDRPGPVDPARVAAFAATVSALPPATPLRRPRRVPVALAAAAALVLAVALGAWVGMARGQSVGEAEFRATLATGQVQAQISGRLVPFGRVVELRSDDLPVLPKGQFYEVWFVTDGDAQPRRVSAGTFHPDDEGHTDVSLFAAIDPRRYPRVEVTAVTTASEVVLSGDVRLL